MKKFIFLSLPGHGHTNPTLVLARELQRRGHTVLYYSTEEFREKIEKNGITYRPYPVHEYIDGRISQNISSFAKVLLSFCEQKIPDLMEEIKIENPDCIIHDTLAVWGKIIGGALKIPSVSVFTTFAYNNKVLLHFSKATLPMIAQGLLRGHQYAKAVTAYRGLCKKYNVVPDGITEIIVSKEKLNLVFTSSMVQPFASSFSNTYKFIGPMLPIKKEKKAIPFLAKTDKKIIYISIGTVFNDNLSFYRMCIAAFKDTPYRIILSLGHRFTLSDLPEIPENMIVKNYIPQLEVLQKADVFISHAGMNSMHESFYYGVPLIAIPQMHEQTVNAMRITQLGAGIYLKKEKITAQTLLQSVEKILQTKEYKENIKKIQKSFQDAGGYTKGVQEILDFIE